MFCTACGAQNSDDARFCNQCGARATPAVGPPATPSPEPAVAAPAAVSGAQSPVPERLPTAGGSGVSVQLPLSGPSRRTLLVAGSGIGLGGAILGALLGLAALRKPPPQVAQIPSPPVTTEGSSVALVETLALRPAVAVDAGARGNAAGASGARGARGAGASARNPGASNAAGSTAGASAGASAGNAAGAPASVGASAGGTAAASEPGAHPTPQAAAASGGARGAAGAAGSARSASSAGASAAARADAGGASGAGASGDNGGGAAAASGELPADLGSETGGGGPRAPTQGGYREGAATDATGTMDPAAFNFVYRHYRSQIAACHSNASRTADVRGTVRVRVRLGTDGHVLRTQIVNDSTNNTELTECVQTTIRRWRYPQPEGGEVEFEYNMGFGS